MLKQINEVTCVFQGLEGVGAIYISGITGAKNLTVLQKLNIKAVVCAARSGFLQYQKSTIEDYLYIPADDNQQFDLSQYFQKAYDFIEKNRKKTNILVHCMAGISRSATLVVAYLIKKYGYSTNSILTILKRKRSIINPNDGFLKQLKSFENQYETKDERRSVKKLNSQDGKKDKSFSARKQSHIYDIKSIDKCHKRTLSRQSKQFLDSFKKKQSGQINAFQRRKSLMVQNIISASQKQNNIHHHLKRDEIISNRMNYNNSVAQLKEEVQKLQIKLEQEDDKVNLMSTASSFKVNDEIQKEKQSIVSQKSPTPLSERLQLMKANLMRQYRLKKLKHHNEDISSIGEEQRKLDLKMAIKIIKCNSKPKRSSSRKFSQLVQRC